MKSKQIKPADLIIAVDTREQRPLTPELEKLGYQCKKSKLDVGDYSLLRPDLSKILAIERKSIADLVACFASSNRPRFERELLHLRAYKYKMVLIEGSYSDIAEHRYRSKASPAAVISSISKYQSDVPFVFADSRENAAFFLGKYLLHRATLLWKFARHAFELADDPHAAEITNTMKG